MRGGSAEREEDKFSPEKLGRKILLNRDEFAAESYRRNGIFDENSYFNHPIKNTGDYMRGFSDGKAKKATTVEPATYSEAYRSSVDSEPSAPVNGMLYGDAPAQKLSDEGAVQDVSADSTTAYTAPETAAEPFVQEGPIVPDEDDVDFGAPETDIDDSAELFSSDTPERGAESMPSASSEQPAVDSDRSFPSSRFDSRRLDETLFPSAESDDSDSVFPSSDRGDSCATAQTAANFRAAGTALPPAARRAGKAALHLRCSRKTPSFRAGPIFQGTILLSISLPGRLLPRKCAATIRVRTISVKQRR